MEIELSNAVGFFYPNPSLLLVYFEAIANSIQAKATKIEIDISIDSYEEANTLELIIKDNGNGFTDENFNKFKKLLKTDNPENKGLGRLVFINYFSEVEIESFYERKHRWFIFNNEFDGTSKVETSKSKEETPDETIIRFKGHRKKKVNTYDYLIPKKLKREIEIHFFPAFHIMKQSNMDLEIKIKLSTGKEKDDVGFSSQEQKIIVSKIPDLQKIDLSIPQLDLFGRVDLFYSVKQTNESKSIITSVCAEGRTIPIDVLSKDEIPNGWEVVFLVYSSWFNGKVSSSRQELELTDSEMKILTKQLSDEVSIILAEQIPSIKEHNDNVEKTLETKYPHLKGLFEDKPVGLRNKDKTIEEAQRKFFQLQKRVLNASSLSDEEFDISLNISARVLTEYILYRNIMINKVKEVGETESEAEIHNMIVPQRRQFLAENKVADVYTNNAWLLDDKYMSYSYVLSENEMSSVLSAISDQDVSRDNKRPDIALVFSGNPSKSKKVDVVIVELKKKGLKLEEREKVVSQLRQRARKLLKFYPSKIQRIWLYGIVDFSEDFITSLIEDEFVPLFSNDSHFYNEKLIIPDNNNRDYRVPVGLNVLSFDAFIEDAQARNATFLDILKNSFNQE